MIPVSTAAVRYLDQWFLVEAPIRARLLSDRAAEQLQGVAGAAGFFKVARNLPRAYDERRGLPRYEPVRAALSALRAGEVAYPDLLVPAFARRLSEQYGGRGALSFASKILWVRFRDPVVIYDSKARQALGAPVGDYPAFRARWEERWQAEAPAIAQACHDPGSVLGEARCTELLPAAEIRDALAAPWFQRRVLDVLLWYEGSEPAAARGQRSRAAVGGDNVARKSVTPPRHIAVTARPLAHQPVPRNSGEEMRMDDEARLYEGLCPSCRAIARKLRPLLERDGIECYAVPSEKQVRAGRLIRVNHHLVATMQCEQPRDGMLLCLAVGEHSTFMAPAGHLSPDYPDQPNTGHVPIASESAIPDWLPEAIDEAFRYEAERSANRARRPRRGAT